MAFRYPAGLITANSPVTANYPSGVWTNQQSAPYINGNVWTTDQYFENTTLLLHGDGTNGAQNNTFLDSSTNNFTVTRNGNTTQGTFSPFSQTGWSNYFDGTGDYLTVANNAALQMGTGDFTVEAFVYPTASRFATVVCLGRYLNNAGVLRIQNDNTVRWYFNDNSVGVTTSNTVTLNAWNHICASRVSGTTRVFINGVQGGSFSDSSNYNSTYQTVIGAEDQTSIENPVIGYISNARVVKGSGVTSVTVPTTPLTAISGTSLLTCQSNRFVDNSSNAFAITRNGDVSVQAFSPFAPTAAYSAATVGGSGYFDGSGDYLSLASNANLTPASGDFCVECWIYPIAFDTYNGIFVGNAVSGFFFGKLTGGIGLRISATSDVISATAPSTNQWTHVAITRSGTNVRLFYNGVQQGSTVTNSTNFAQSATYIGTDGSGGSYWNGYISGLRFVKGSAVYTSNFTPSTTPLTAITNTQLLLNFTNAGIFDNAQMNNLETVGNAQISTSVKKFGTGSLAFDGTGDWLTMPNSKGLYIGSGDFTIEGWLYLNATGATKGIVSQFSSGGAGPGWTLYIKTTNVLEFYGGSGTVTVTGTTAIAATTWTHFAVVRSGSTITIYVNGVAGGTATNSSFSDDTTALGYVGGRADSSALSLNGYIDDLRITKGIARYTANFTPPIARMPNQ